MEIFARSQKKGEVHFQTITLREKKTGKTREFRLMDQNNIYDIKKQGLFTDFESSTKLEVEFDYDTDEEQIKQSKTMLLDDLNQAIDFYVREDPIKLVSNVMTHV